MADVNAVPTAEPPSPSGDQGPAPRPRRDRLATAAVLLIVAGLLLLAVHAVTAGGQRHSYSADATAPSSVSLVSGKEYTISVHGGVRSSALADPTTLTCEIATGGGAATQLTLTPEAATTKATDQVARFVSPLTGRATVTCAGVAAVFVDDAEDAGTDLAGLALLLGIIALALGLPLLCSVLRRHFTPAPVRV